MLLRFIFVASICSSFIFITQWCFITWIYLNLTYIHHFCVLSSLEMWWVKVQWSFLFQALYGHMLFLLTWASGIGMDRTCSSICSTIKAKAALFSKMIVSSYITTNRVWKFQILYTSPTLDIVSPFNFSHSYDFNLQFSNSKDTEYLCMCLLDILYLLWNFSFRYFGNL